MGRPAATRARTWLDDTPTGGASRNVTRPAPQRAAAAATTGRSSLGRGQRGHLETDARRRPLHEILVRRRGRRHEEHALETEPRVRLGGDDKMADVRRVETAADDAEARACLLHGARGAPARRPTART